MKKFFQSLLATLVAFSSLLLMPVPIAHAASTCTWTGGGVDTNWSTPGNWSGCGATAPSTNDSLVFNNTAANITSNNDLPLAPGPALVFNTISFVGSSTTHTTSITGDPFEINNNLNIDVSNVTIANNITFNNVISSTGIKVDTAGLENIEIIGNIALASGGQDMNIDLKSDVYHSGAMTGTTHWLVLGDSGSAYNGHWKPLLPLQAHLRLPTYSFGKAPIPVSSLAVLAILLTMSLSRPI